jgi:succinoglycan biosynthesis protein ExoA
MTPESETRVLVAIPTLNEAANIETIVRALAQEKARLPWLEIAIIDGGSRDDTRVIANRLAAELPFVHMLNNPARIQGAALNLAANRWADRVEVLVRCDAHAIYPENYIERLIAALRQHKAASVVVTMDSMGQSCFQKAVAWVLDTPVGSGGSAYRGGKASGFVDHGHHAAFRLDTFLEANGYDESFSHNEDAELDCRLAAAGKSIYLDAEIRVGYQPRADARALWRQYFQYGRGRSRTIRRHRRSARLRQLAVPLHLIVVILSVLMAAITGRALWLAWPTIYLTVLGLISLRLALRKASPCGLLAGLAAAIMHTAWACGFFHGLIFIRERAWNNPTDDHVMVASRSAVTMSVSPPRK